MLQLATISSHAYLENSDSSQILESAKNLRPKNQAQLRQY